MRDRRLPGIARGKAVPAAKWERQQFFHLPNSIFFQTITGDWAEAATDGFTEPDMILRPDLDTATAAPWTGDGTLQVIHDAYDLQGNPVGHGAPQRAQARGRPLPQRGLDPHRRARDGVLPRSARTSTPPRRSCP
jgi:glutamine synthetase